MKRTNNIWRTAVLVTVLVVSLWAGARFGSTWMSPTAFWGALLRRAGFETQTVILYAVRLPRVLAAVVAGAGLSLSGVLLQGVTDNPLAAPNLIGVNAGAGFGMVLVLSVAPTALSLMTPAAFLGAFLTTLVIVSLAARSTSRAALILAGVAVSTALSAVISCFTYADTDLLASFNAFSVGGFAGVGVNELILPAIAVTLCAVVCAVLGDRIDLLCLGDASARLLGARVGALRLVCVLCASIAAASAVSFAGLLGFVGLIVPHIARHLYGYRTRPLVVASCAIGATVCVLADLVGRTVAAPSEIPVGIMMALLGAPFFLWLLVRRGGRSTNE
ncbi:MAG: iron ABC transporter permease [Clostridia bacterium]|nr:iron ABC transporter permease [Clostridia bacterium]